MNDQKNAQLITKKEEINRLDLLFGFKSVRESILQEIDEIIIKPRKILKDKIIIEKKLMFCDINNFTGKTKAIIEYDK